MNDDLRNLVENELPVLAGCIARDMLRDCGVVPRSEHPDQRIRDRWHPGQVDLTEPMQYMGPTTDRVGGGQGYVYCPVAAGPNEHNGHRGNGGFAPGAPYKAAKIVFYNVRLTGIEDVLPGDLDVLNPDDRGAKLTVDSYINDGPEPYRKRVEVEEEREREEDHSFGVLVGLEFRRRTLARGGIEMEGIEAGGEVETEITLRAEARTDHEWRRSDRIRHSVEHEYSIAPYHRWSLTSRETIKHIRQDVLVVGKLQCAVRIDSRDRNSTDFDSLDDLIEVGRGLKTGYGPYSRWFGEMRKALPDATFAAWPRPQLRLNLPIEGRRTRYSQAVSRQKPLKNRSQEIEDLETGGLPDLEFPEEWGVEVDGED